MSWRRLLPALVAAALLLPGSARGAEDDPPSRVKEILTSLHATPPAKVPDVVRRLAQLGPDGLPALLDAWWADPTRTPVSVAARRRRSPTGEALHRAISAHGPSRLLARLEAHAADHPDDATRLLLLESVAAFGDGSALAFAVDLVRALDANWLRTPTLAGTWRSLLDGLLSSGMRSRELTAAWARIPATLRLPSCRVLVERGTTEDLALVLDLAVLERDDAPALYHELMSASPVVLDRLQPLRRLTRQLAHDDPAVRASVATALGRLGEPAAFDDLLALLEDEDERVHAAARSALRSLTGVSFGARRTAWAGWYAAERAWLESSDVHERLQADDPVAIARALRELGRHRMIAAGLVGHVTDLLAHDRAAIRLMACAALRGLGRPAAAFPLVDALKDDDEDVRRAAWMALKQLSHERLPPNPREWAQARRRWKS